ncbi:MAG: hypothetical protein ACXWXQ_07945 [Actinomycetota bacterium]
MLELATSAFLILHGLVHLGYATPKVDDERFPFVPERAWFTSAAHLTVHSSRALFASIAVMTVVVYSVAGVGVLLGAGWWQPFAVAGSFGSLAVLILGFHPWLVFGVAINAAIIAAVVARWPVVLFD